MRLLAMDSLVNQNWKWKSKSSQIRSLGRNTYCYSTYIHSNSKAIQLNYLTELHINLILRNSSKQCLSLFKCWETSSNFLHLLAFWRPLQKDGCQSKLMFRILHKDELLYCSTESRGNLIVTFCKNSCVHYWELQSKFHQSTTTHYTI